jgi:outer membrane protein assembly factor BamD
MKSALALSLLIFLFGCSETKTKPEKNLVKAPDLPEETILQNGIATYDEGLFKVSLSYWSELRDGYPTSYYSTLAEIKMADAHFFSGDYPAALVAYEEFAKLHPGHEAMPYVRYQIGNCSFKQYKDVMHDQAPLQTALKSYEQLIEQHPKSEYVVLARRQIDRCKELQAAYEKYVADFYARKGLDTAATSRIKKLSTEFPGSKAMGKLQEELGNGNAEIKKEAAVGGKIPSPPKLVSSALLDESHYTEGLRTLKDRNSKRFAVVEEVPLPPVPIKASVEEQKELSEFSCEETSRGAVFIISTFSPVINKPLKSDDLLKFSWAEKNPSFRRENQTELCSAAELTLEVTTSNTGLVVKLPSQAVGNFDFIVLNRPNRVVLNVSSGD